MFNKVEALLLLFPLLVLFPLLFLEIEVEEIVDCKLRVKELLKELVTWSLLRLPPQKDALF